MQISSNFQEISTGIVPYCAAKMKSKEQESSELSTFTFFLPFTTCSGKKEIAISQEPLIYSSTVK